jgi:hypothetical protein
VAAPKGNRFWEARSKSGRNPIFSSPEQLWESCVEYFEWAEENPLQEEKATQFQGEFVKTDVSKMRAMTIDGLCIFLDISNDTWRNYRDREDFFEVTKKTEQIIRQQKFSGAAADLLNANIIARDLGLVDKKEHGSDPNKPVQVIAREMSADEATAAYRSIIDD